MNRRYFLILAGAALWLPAGRSSEPLVNASMLARLKKNYSQQAERRGLALNALLDELQHKPVEVQLREVNRFFNQFEYHEDIDIWGQQDYWQTPEEFLGLQKGDCEDFVIAKYFSLRKLGIPDKRLYLTYVKALERKVAHMVLSYFATPTSTPLILDNYNPYILPADKRQDLLPVYSFNAQSLFLNNAAAGLGRALPTDRIKNSKWKKLLSDIQRDSP